MLRFVYGACGLFTTVMAMCALADMTRQSNGFGVIAAGMEFMAWGTFSGLFLTGAFLPGVTERFADAVFYPVRRLKKPAPLLSPILGLIGADRFDEAREAFQRLLGGPDCDLPAAWLAWFRMELENCDDPGAADAVAERCFAAPRRSAAPEYAELLRRWFISAAGTEAEKRVRARIREELHRHRRAYSPGERRELEALLEQP